MENGTGRGGDVLGKGGSDTANRTREHLPDPRGRPGESYEKQEFNGDQGLRTWDNGGLARPVTMRPVCVRTHLCYVCMCVVCICVTCVCIVCVCICVCMVYVYLCCVYMHVCVPVCHPHGTEEHGELAGQVRPVAPARARQPTASQVT